MVDELWYYTEEHGTFTMGNGLINGTNVYHSVGQRLDIELISGITYRLRLINALRNNWLQAIPQNTCSDNDNASNIKSIVYYVCSPIADPTTEAFPMPDNCDDKPMDSLVSALSFSPSPNPFSTQKSTPAILSLANYYFRWEIGPQPIQVA